MDRLSELIAEKVASRLLAQQLITDKIMSRKEAMIYTRHRSNPAFTAWAKRWEIRTDSRGRWSRTRLDLALEREAGAARIPAQLNRNRCPR